MWTTAIVIGAAVLTPGQGEGEGEIDPCAVVCLDAATLTYCDADDVVSLDCADVDASAVCALHSDAWGFDCVLPAGSACDPAYAFGLSRCAAGLACLDGSCAPGTPPDDVVLEPTDGTAVATSTTGTTTDVFSCLGCPSSSLLMFMPAWVLRRRRR